MEPTDRRSADREKGEEHTSAGNLWLERFGAQRQQKRKRQVLLFLSGLAFDNAINSGQ
jgi:hypothetical protein